jgi:hypothetical protein
MLNRTSLLLLLSVIETGACTLPEVEPQLGTVSAASGCLPQFGCNLNAKSMPFELDTGPSQQKNANGFRIKEVIPPPPYTGSMTLMVPPADDELFGTLASGTLRGSELIGTTIVITGPTGTWDIRLDDVSRFDFLVGGGQATSYRFTFKPGNVEHGVWTDFCPDESESVTVEGEQHHALVFRGDRYHPKTTQVTESLEPWINIACAGTAVAKLHLLRHTKAGTHIPYVTTIPERQAMLRMLRADYCGNGGSYTEDGTPLRYADRYHWHPDGIDLTQSWQRALVEAVWDHNGAVCLDLPRLVDPSTISCPVPRPHCPADLSGWTSFGHVVSTLPFPDPPPP